MAQHRQKVWDLMIVIVLVAMVLMLGVGAVYIDKILPSPSLPKASAKVDLSLAKVEFGDNPNAKIHLLFFGDYECPNTKADWEMIKRIRDDYKGRINLAWVHTPLDIHQHAEPAARAVVCAQQQGKFWEMSDALFAHQGSLGDASLAQYAKDIGLDAELFLQCFMSDEARIKVRDDLIFAVSRGVRGTPTYVIDGRWFEGVQDEGFLRGLLDSALEAKR